jgi:hypothetical protein
MLIRFATIGVLFVTVGCTQPPRVPEQAPDLRPFVAIAGLYSVWGAASSPDPVSPSTECTAGCKCRGTGRESSGGGETVTACRCPESCLCKRPKQGAAPCPTGKCPPQKSMPR